MAPPWWSALSALEPGAPPSNMAGMENDPFTDSRRPPVLDMTLEGQFRTAPEPTGGIPRRSWLDRLLGRVGGAALLLALATGGLVLAGLAVLAIGLLLPVMLVAGLVAFGTLWWRVRRAAKSTGRSMRFVVVRR
jgi:hypothetical protein